MLAFLLPPVGGRGQQRSLRWSSPLDTEPSAGVTSARGANRSSAEALALAVAVICGWDGSPVSRSPEHAVAPAAVIDAVLAAVSV